MQETETGATPPLHLGAYLREHVLPFIAKRKVEIAPALGISRMTLDLLLKAHWELAEVPVGARFKR